MEALVGGQADAQECTIGQVRLSWKSMADELDTNREARVAQYVVSGQVATQGHINIHLATDKASGTGQSMQNTIFTIPNNVAILACPQALQTTLNFPLYFYGISGNLPNR